MLETSANSASGRPSADSDVRRGDPGLTGAGWTRSARPTVAAGGLAMLVVGASATP